MVGDLIDNIGLVIQYVSKAEYYFEAQKVAAVVLFAGTDDMGIDLLQDETSRGDDALWPKDGVPVRGLDQVQAMTQLAAASGLSAFSLRNWLVVLIVIFGKATRVTRRWYVRQHPPDCGYANWHGPVRCSSR